MGPSTRPIMQQGVIPYMAKLIVEDPSSILLIQPKRQPEKKQQGSSLAHFTLYRALFAKVKRGFFDPYSRCNPAFFYALLTVLLVTSVIEPIPPA